MSVLGTVALTLAAAAQGKDSFTPMALDAGFGPMDISTPSTPPDQIITKFAAKESEFQEALNHYTYRRVARVQTLDDDNKVDGEWYEVDDVIFDPSGPPHGKSGVCAGKHSAAGDDVAVRPAGHSARIPVCSHDGAKWASTTSSMWAGKRWTRWIAMSLT